MICYVYTVTAIFVVDFQVKFETQLNHSLLCGCLHFVTLVLEFYGVNGIYAFEVG